MEERKVLYKRVSHTISTTKLENDCNETKITTALNGINIKVKNEIKKHINGVIKVLQEHKIKN